VCEEAAPTKEASSAPPPPPRAWCDSPPPPPPREEEEEEDGLFFNTMTRNPSMEKKVTRDVHIGESIARMLCGAFFFFVSFSLSLSRARLRAVYIYNGERERESRVVFEHILKQRLTTEKRETRYKNEMKRLSRERRIIRIYK
jgi:hypothetical protein